jgi:hypothetical protein
VARLVGVVSVVSVEDRGILVRVLRCCKDCYGLGFFEVIKVVWGYKGCC